MIATPADCPDAGRHAPTIQRSAGDYRKVLRRRCPSCGFWCLPPAPRPTAAELAGAFRRRMREGAGR